MLFFVTIFCSNRVYSSDPINRIGYTTVQPNLGGYALIVSAVGVAFKPCVIQQAVIDFRIVVTNISVVVYTIVPRISPFHYVAKFQRIVDTRDLNAADTPRVQIYASVLELYVWKIKPNAFVWPGHPLHR